jgi:hypothetical protein
MKPAYGIWIDHDAVLFQKEIDICSKLCFAAFAKQDYHIPALIDELHLHSVTVC